MNKLTVGILAHVDSGKTTLSEALLYETGAITSLGRVDKGDAHLDNNPDEKSRGITIYSKNARVMLRDADTELILIDTPGHVDFSTEMERALSVMDIAILLISASSLVQSHTKTLWSLLNSYRIPTYIFVNKMDMPGVSKDRILTDIKEKLTGSAVDFTDMDTDKFYEDCATITEERLEEFFENGSLSNKSIVEDIENRRLFPVFFGSALRLEGIKEFISGLSKYLVKKEYEAPEVINGEFSGIVYKISRDDKSNRLSYLKILSGSLEVKGLLGNEKINELRLYSGYNYSNIKKAYPGEVVAIPSLIETKIGDIFGRAGNVKKMQLMPAISYAVKYPRDIDRSICLKNLMELSEEDPSLNVTYHENTKEIMIFLMGDVQAEILKNNVRERYGYSIDFTDGKVMYKETIDDTAEGVGHFEPLRHYAEAHIMLSPNERGMGMTFEADISEDLLDKNWQRLIYTHMIEREHRGVLLGASITDIHLKLVSGRAHIKHTEGGDFRQATYRAIRQGLMQLKERGNCHLLEPYYEYSLEIPTEYVGRAMTDITKMCGTSNVAETDADNQITILTGRAPVSTMNGYTKEIAAYTKGLGRLYLTLSGYDKCHNEEEVLEKSTYNPEADFHNPTGSVFCSHGAGTVIPWDEVFENMHIELGSGRVKSEEDALCEAKNLNSNRRRMDSRGALDISLSVEDIDNILRSANLANEKGRQSSYKGVSIESRLRRKNAENTVQVNGSKIYRGAKIKDKYILVDGYNIIHAWDELKQYKSVSIDAAAESLNEILCNYSAIKGVPVMVVYDAYKVKGRKSTERAYKNITVVYTGEALTADRYIERYAHENSSKYDITVATSDKVERVIVSGQGAHTLSAMEFHEEVTMLIKEFKETYGVK